jgi:hypothetical protein
MRFFNEHTTNEITHFPSAFETSGCLVCLSQGATAGRGDGCLAENPHRGKLNANIRLNVMRNYLLLPTRRGVERINDSGCNELQQREIQAA